eukprot:g2584.t1
MRPSNASGYVGPLRLGATDGTLCITAASASASAASAASAAAASLALTLETCTPGAASQQWSLGRWSIGAQRVVHTASGYCLDIPGAAGAASNATAGLPVLAVPCNATSMIQKQWQLGASGALITRHAQISVAAVPPPAAASAAAAVAAPPLIGWNPSWGSGYPAVRDLKAAVRFVRARAGAYGIDATRVVVSGGSAGATNSVAAGATFEGDYVRELSTDQDPTLASTHLEQNSSVQCVVSHWASDGEIALAQAHDPLNRTRYGKSNAPIIEFHGDADTTISISHARAVQAAYNRTGVPYELHVLEGCGHAAWCYDGAGTCSCKNGVAGYGSKMDSIALPFVAKQLALQLL